MTSDSSAVGLRCRGFLVPTPVWIKRRRCSGNKGRCQKKPLEHSQCTLEQGTKCKHRTLQWPGNQGYPLPSPTCALSPDPERCKAVKKKTDYPHCPFYIFLSFKPPNLEVKLGLSMPRGRSQSQTLPAMTSWCLIMFLIHGRLVCNSLWKTSKIQTHRKTERYL